MTTMTIDTLKLADKLESAGFNRDQAAAVVRAIAESQDELVTTKDLDIALAPIKTDLAVLKWGMVLIIAGVAAQLFKAFFQ
jgi:Tfp pilus assembly ATPase PilU